MASAAVFGFGLLKYGRIVMYSAVSADMPKKM
jgi:hypothetical protein